MSQVETKVQYALKNATKAMERIGALEGIVPQIIVSTQKSLQQIDGRFQETEKRLEQLAELVDAMVEMMGPTEVGSVLQEARKNRHLQKVEADKKQLADDIAANKLVKAEAITEKSTVVLTERTQEGQELPISRVQFTFPQLTEEVRKEVLGQKIGYVIKPPNSNVFEVVEIYDDVTPAPAPTPAETQPQAEA